MCLNSDTDGTDLKNNIDMGCSYFWSMDRVSLGKLRGITCWSDSANL